MTEKHEDFLYSDDINVVNESTGWIADKAVITPYLPQIAGTCGIPAAIAHATGLTIAQVDSLIDKRPSFRKAVEAERRACLELIEYSIMKRAQGGDTNAARYLLETFAKDRGFGKQEQQDTTPRIIFQMGGVDTAATPTVTKEEWSRQAKAGSDGK